MWLLDANIDVHLVSVLGEFGVRCETVASRGWQGLSNADLVAAAAAEGFTCLLTRDQLFGESASRAIKAFPEFSVVVLGLPQRPWRKYCDQFRAAWETAPILPMLGRLTHWPSPR